MARRLREPAAPYGNTMAGSPASAQGAYGEEIPPGLLRPRNGAGRAALICGVLALICAIGFFLLVTIPVAALLGLAAVVLGFMGRGRVRRGLATNRGSATTGLVTGLLALLILVGVGIAAATFWNNHKGEFKSYSDCVQQAGSNQQKQQDCATQFKNQVTK